MTGKLVTDAVQRQNGPTLALPLNLGDDGNGGNMTVDENGNLLVVPPPPPETIRKSEFDLMLDLSVGNIARLEVLWADFHEGLTLDDIAFVKLCGMGIMSEASAMQLHFKALSAPGATKDTGYMGATYFSKTASSSSTAGNVSHNSNNGHMIYPIAGSVAPANYGHSSGNLNFQAQLYPHDNAYQKGVHMKIEGSYHQNATHNSPNVEQVAWGSYDSSAGISGFNAGFAMYPHTGVLDHGFLQATVVLKEAIEV